MINTQNNSPNEPQVPTKKIPNSSGDGNSEKDKTYSQEDIDLLDEKFREKEKLLQKMVGPANPVLEQYRKSLVPEQNFERETIVYDQTIGKWKIVKDQKEVK